METEPNNVTVPTLEDICQEIWDAAITANEYCWRGLPSEKRDTITRVVATAIHAGRSLEWKCLPSHDIASQSRATHVRCIREGDATSKKLRSLEGLVHFDVLKAIQSERAYQEQKWPGHMHTVAEWLLIMQKCLDDAKRAWVTGHGDEQALHEIRQVTAVGVAAMEQCGAPIRPPFRTGECIDDLQALSKDELIKCIRFERRQREG